MNTKHLLIAAIGLTATFATSNAFAAFTVASWNFNTTTSQATILATTGGTQISTATLTNTSLGTYTTGTVAANQYTTFTGSEGQAIAIAGNSSNNNKAMTFTLSMTGLSELKLSYSTRYSGTSAFTNQNWSYSLDGSSFTSFQDITVSSTSFTTKNVDFSSVNALNGAPTVYIRMTFSGATGSGVTNDRVDAVSFTAVPEPHEYALGMAALLGAVIIIRRRKAAQMN